MAMFNGQPVLFSPTVTPMPTASETTIGGIKAKAKTTEDLEAAIGTDAKLYVPSNVFVAKYDETTHQQIANAITAGKAVIAMKGNAQYSLDGRYPDIHTGAYYFSSLGTGTSPSKSILVCRNGNDWSQSAATFELRRVYETIETITVSGESVIERRWCDNNKFYKYIVLVMSTSEQSSGRPIIFTLGCNNSQITFSANAILTVANKTTVLAEDYNGLKVIQLGMTEAIYTKTETAKNDNKIGYGYLKINGVGATIPSGTTITIYGVKL